VTQPDVTNPPPSTCSLSCPAVERGLYLSPSRSTRFQKALVRFAEAPAGKYHKKFKARFHPVTGALSSQVQEPTVQAASGTSPLPTRRGHGDEPRAWHAKELMLSAAMDKNSIFISSFCHPACCDLLLFKFF